MTEQYVKNYALALYSLCQEEGISLSDTYEELKLADKVFSENNEFIVLLSLPTITKDEKKAMLSDCFEGKLSDIVYDFICVMTENNAIMSFSDVFLSFKKLYFEESRIVEVEVITTQQLSDGLYTKLKSALEKKLSKSVILDTKIDTLILGGIVINYDNKQLDASLKTKLADIKKSIDCTIA